MREDPYVYGGSTDMELELEDRLRDKAGAGRGGQGGPTAKELADYERKQNAGIFMAGMKPPQDIDGGSVKKKVVKKAEGGMTEREQFDADVDRAKKGLYKQKGEAAIYSRERGMGPGMAAKRLRDRGVDIEGMIANEPTDSDMKKGGKVKSKYMSFSKTGKPDGMKSVKKMASGGMTASGRGDGIAQRGKTRGKMC